jgi:DNA invertase Pin-like site-specific DNA recombinase
VSDTRESGNASPMNVMQGQVQRQERPYRYLTDDAHRSDGRLGGSGLRVVGYVRVSTEDQAKGLSLEDQRERIAREVELRGWELAGVECDKASGKSAKRPALQRALAGLATGEYQALMVVRLDRLSRRMMDFCEIVQRAEESRHRAHPWAIVSLDPEIDMTSPAGRAMAQMLILFAEWERELIGKRQKESIAARKRAGTYKPTPKLISAAAEERIAHLRSEGFGARRIRRQLELEGFEPPQGRVWHLSTVQASMRRSAA